MADTMIGVIGGSGLYEIDGLENAEWQTVETPWGAPSDAILTGTGCVAHVSVAHPTCPRLGAACLEAAKDSGINVHNGGTYLAMEGPQFSTLAESKMYRESWGADVIGMTNMPEAKLAREAELCYASVAMITDYDSWHPDHGEVDVTQIIATLMGNASKARDLVAKLPDLLGASREACPHGCDKALEYAILTAPEARDLCVGGQVRCRGRGVFLGDFC
ncbi:S-methyl-5'-thioadenosine phosphorylase [Nymphon striatum]|nr:S-methyl-5'-thioadenosine phosphorylase [Nymphon striatum]